MTADDVAKAAPLAVAVPMPTSPVLATSTSIDSLSLSGLVRAFSLIFGEGMSLGLCCWALLSSPRVQSYALENRLPVRERVELLAAAFGTGALGLLLAALYLGISTSGSLRRLQEISARLAPLLVAGILPYMFRWQLWQARELTFGILVTVLGFALHAAILKSLQAPPLFGARLLPLQRLLARLARRWEPWLPATLVVLGALGYAAFFSYFTVANHRNLRTASFDLGLEDNLLWNVLHGGQFMKSSPLVGPVGSHFGYHATFFAYVIAPFYALYQRPEALLIFQSVMIGAAVLPLYALAKRYVSKWAACLVGLAYLLYPPAHGSNLYDFHYIPLGVFFLWLTLYLLETRRYKWTILAVVLTLSVREDVSAALIIVGAYLIFSGRNPRGGIAVASAAAVYFFLMKGVVMPRFLEGGQSFVHQYAGLLPPGERGFGGVMKTVLANPVYTLTSLLEEEKLLYIVQIGAPLCFFPWRRPIGLLCSLPGFFFTLLATGYPPLIQISFQYTAHWTAFLFVALLANLAWIHKPAFAGDLAGTIRQRAWLSTIVLLTVFTSYQYGAILQQNTARGGFGPYVFKTSPEDRANYQKVLALIAKVPPRAKICSSENLVPHVSSRPDSYTLRVGVFDAEYLLFSLPSSGEEAANLRPALAGAFGVVQVLEPYVLAKRGHSKELNPSVMSRVR
jgi:uncharacterized membrane protein